MAEIDTGTQEFKDAVASAVGKSEDGLKSALAKERESVKTAKDALSKFDGIDPDKHRELVEGAEKAEAERQKSQGDWEARETKLQEGFDTQLKKIIGERDAAVSERDAKTSELDGVLRKKEVLKAIAEAKGSVVLLEDVVLKNTKLVEVDGKQVVQVLDDNGAPKLKDGAKNASDFMGIAEYVTSLKDQDGYAGAFEGAGGSGSGGTRDATGSQGSDAAKRAAQRKADGVVFHTAGN